MLKELGRHQSVRKLLLKDICLNFIKMKNLCCIPCDETPNINIDLTCTCCASSFNENTKHCDKGCHVKRGKHKSCKSCCCRCKKRKRQNAEDNQDEPVNE